MYVTNTGSIINVVVSEKGITTFLNLWQKNKRFEVQ
jgi:IS1 family transposase